MTNLVFKSGMRAFEYAGKFFDKDKLSAGSSYIGVVTDIDRTGSVEVYKVLILCKNGSMFSRKSTLIVAAFLHPELDAKIVEDDLVRFGVDQLKHKIPTGFILEKYSLELDVVTGQFLPYQPPVSQKYRVIVRDHFHYMDEDETYVDGEYDTIDEALKVSQKIIDDYLVSRLDQGFSAKELYDDYMMFGEDPSIEGVFWSASGYAQTKAEELVSTTTQKSQTKQHGTQDETFHKVHAKFESGKLDDNIYKPSSEAKPVAELNPGISEWAFSIKHSYGNILPNSEILENEFDIYYKQTNKNKLVARWSKTNKTWSVLFNHELPTDLNFSSPSRFEELVFANHYEPESYYQKQYLLEYLLFGLGEGQRKNLSFKARRGGQLSFSLDARTWNAMLIGNRVSVEGACKYITDQNEEERVHSMTLQCADWYLTLEVLFNADEDYEEMSFGIKELQGYYT